MSDQPVMEMSSARRELSAWVLASALLISGVAGAEEEPQERYARFKPAQTYYLHVPSGYQLGKRERYPLFVAVHAASSSGLGEFRLWQPYAEQEGVLLLTPNFAGGYESLDAGSDRELLKLIEEVGTDYRVDRRRVLLTGIGEGSEFVYRFAMRYPHVAHTVVLVHPGELPEPVRARPGEAARFLLVVYDTDEEADPHHEALAEQLRWAGYPVMVSRGPAGHSIPSQAVMAVVRLVRAMKLSDGAGS